MSPRVYLMADFGKGPQHLGTSGALGSTLRHETATWWLMALHADRLAGSFRWWALQAEELSDAASMLECKCRGGFCLCGKSRARILRFGKGGRCA